MLTAKRLAELSTRGPRYTSYPPATQLGAIDDAIVVDELARIGAGSAPVSLYVHVPFCRSLCAYCGCNVIPTRDRSRGAKYVDQLVLELATLQSLLGRRVQLSELALGGGSPNFLDSESLRRLVDAIAEHFELAADARRSIELDPRTTTRDQLAELAALGFRSLSVGVQDFADRVQDAIRRHQTVAQTRELLDNARELGFDDVNIDIVYGLPKQTEMSFATTLDAVISAAPDRVALFGYAHLPSRFPHQILVERAGRPLDPYERATLLLQASERFAAAGYVHLGLDHFARRDSALARAAEHHALARTFQGYVERRADSILGVGTSAISSTPRVFWQNHVGLEEWSADVSRGRLPFARGLQLCHDDRIRRTLIERLMCDGTADLRALGAEHGIDASAYLADDLATLDAELASYDAGSGRIVTTPLGQLLVRNVCMAFDRYARAASSFSPTI